MKTFHAFEIVEESSFIMYVDTDLLKVDMELERSLRICGNDLETYAVGTVEADTVDEALNKIRRGDWDYSQKCDTIVPGRVQGSLRECLEAMISSGQCEAKAIADVVCDALETWDDSPEELAVFVADEFVGWGEALRKSSLPKRAARSWGSRRCHGPW